MTKKLKTISNSVAFIGRYLSKLESQRLSAGDWFLAVRNDEALTEIASDESQASRYWRAVCLNRCGKSEEAEDLLRSVIGNAPPPIKSRGLVTLGSVLVERGEFGSAALMYAAASQSAVDPLTALTALRMKAVLRSIAGFHREALDELERACPLVGSISPNHPARLDFYNSVACVLKDLGRSAQALPLVALVASAPIARKYPEWLETRREVVLQIPTRTAVRIPVSQNTESAQIISFPERATDEERRALRRIKALAVVGDTNDDALIDIVVTLGASDRETSRAILRMLNKLKMPPAVQIAEKKLL